MACSVVSLRGWQVVEFASAQSSAPSEVLAMCVPVTEAVAGCATAEVVCTLQATISSDMVSEPIKDLGDKVVVARESKIGVRVE